jgi:RND family efflux transporter MFP subunit
MFQKLMAMLRAVFRRPLLIILIAAAIVFVMMATRPELAAVDLPERVWPVDVVAARAADQQPMLELFGEVVAGRRSEMRALVPGTIVEVGPNYHEGGAVAKGDLLVQIDPFEYRNDVDEQTALLKEARANLKIKQRDLARISELHAEGNVSEQSLDDAQLAVEQQQAILEQRRIGLARAERALEDSRLVAPYSGVLGDVAVDLGKRLSANDKVADLIDTGRLEVRFTLSNAQLGRLVESGEGITGRQVEVNWQVGNETLKYAAVVERVGAEIDSTTAGIVLYASIVADTRALLRPGAFVWIRLPDKHYKNVYRAPESALYGADQIYVVQDQRMTPHEIDVVGYAGNDILFRAPDVKDGDLIVVTQIREGGEGIKVEVR